MRPIDKNHLVTSYSYPKRGAYYVGPIDVLLKNVVVERKVVNGSIGLVFVRSFLKIVKDRDIKNTPTYILVEYPNSSILDDKKCFPDKTAA